MLAEERGTAARAQPYAPGESPFHVRGAVYRAALEHAERNVTGGLRRVHDACPDRALASFMAQGFDSNGWYDVLPMSPLSDVIASVMGVDTQRYLHERTREHAERDLVGFYRLLIRAVSARTVALFLPKLTSRYYDWGGIEARLRGPRRVETVRSGVPEPLVPWYATVACSFAATALEIAGAPGPRVTLKASKPDGVTQGVATYSQVFDITWNA
jgi:hypothetical protein